MTYAEIIRKYIDANGISQAHICRKAGISKVKFNLVLNGKRKLTVEEYELICRALGVNMNFFSDIKKQKD